MRQCTSRSEGLADAPDQEDRVMPVWQDQPPGNVRCLSCGLLAKFGASSGQDFPLRDRVTDAEDVLAGGLLPYCTAGHWELLDEYQGAIADGSADEGNAALHSALEKHRECADWMHYIDGLSLADHVKRRGMIELERERRAFEKLLRTERVDSDERARSVERRITKYFLILAVLEVVGTLAAVALALIQWGAQ